MKPRLPREPGVPPGKYTLAKYGLAAEDWKALYARQAGLCAVCGKPPSPIMGLVIDHRHAPGWARLGPERRKAEVRGLLCMRCNRYAIGLERFGVTAELHRRAAAYLDRWALDSVARMC